MKEYIDYSNKELEEKVRGVFGKAFGAIQPLIIDVLMRRSFTFKLSDEKTIEDARRVLDNLDKIEFNYMNHNHTGIADAKERTVSISSSLFSAAQKSPSEDNYYREKFLSVFVHELFHILSFHYRTIDKDTGKNIIENCTKENNSNSNNNKILSAGLTKVPSKNTNSYSVTMSEVFNEVASNMVYNNNKELYISNEVSYSHLTFLPHMMSAAIGTTDSELVYPGTQSPDEFNAFLEKQFGIDKSNSNSKRIFQRSMMMIKSVRQIDKNLDLLQNLCTLEREQELENSVEEVRALKESFFNSIVSSVYSLANLHIKSDSREVSQELIDELIVRYKKMDTCVGVAAVKLNLKEYDGLEEIKKQRDDMLRRIWGLNIINNIKDKITDKDLLEKYVYEAKSGRIFNCKDEIIEKYGIDISKEKRSEIIEYIVSEKYKNSQYYRRLEKEDMHDYRNWDTEKSNNIIKNFFIKFKEESDKCKEIKIPVEKVENILATVLGKSANAYDYSRTQIVKALAEDLGEDEKTTEKMYDNILLTRKVFKECLNYGSEIIIQDGDKLKKACENCLIKLSNYYEEAIKFVICKNSSKNSKITLEETLRSAQGYENLKDYYQKTVEYIKQKGSLSEEIVIEIQEKNKEVEELLQKQVTGQYVLLKLENMGVHTATEEEKEAVRKGKLFEMEEKLGFRFSDYMDSKEYKNDIKKQNKRDNHQSFIARIAQHMSFITKVFKNTKALPEGDLKISYKGKNNEEKATSGHTIKGKNEFMKSLKEIEGKTVNKNKINKLGTHQSANNAKQKKKENDQVL